jgi:malonate-semialdehyde dehydrogenase (acetylating) / methylmalonate-semialdehyde dehydrogenase
MSTTEVMSAARLLNYIGGSWVESEAQGELPVVNPATAEILGRVPLSPGSEVARAVAAASRAYPAWRETPAGERVQYLFKLKGLLEKHLDELARAITKECGKTYSESAGELRRAIDNIEVACGIPSLMQGYNSDGVAPGIDEMMIRRPLGVVAAITPFNFPAMIPCWFLPYAIACGNTFVLKPSEKVPLTAAKLFELIAETGLPSGVANLVHGSKETVDALLDHPEVRAVSFVGSSAVARYVYGRAASNGKRAQCQGAAKNPVVILPDADPQLTTETIAESAFGCAGQRCLAASLAIAVGEAGDEFTRRLGEAAASRKVGNGFDAGVQMGPVITPQSKQRVEGLIAQGIREGAKVVVDGRGTQIRGYEQGNFVRPTLLAEMPAAGSIAQTEIFGPVLGLVRVKDLEEAIRLVNQSNYGNMACLFTSSGAAARQFRLEAWAGNIGINVGVAAPMAYFPFCGMKDSFFGDLHGQGRDAVEFYTDKKVVIERWPKA